MGKAVLLLLHHGRIDAAAACAYRVQLFGHAARALAPRMPGKGGQGGPEDTDPLACARHVAAVGKGHRACMRGLHKHGRELSMTVSWTILACQDSTQGAWCPTLRTFPRSACS